MNIFSLFLLFIALIFFITSLIIEKRKRDDMLKKCAVIIRWIFAIIIGIALITLKEGLLVFMGCILILLVLFDWLSWRKSSPRKNNDGA